MATLKRTMEQVMDRDMEEGEDMEGGENCPMPTQDITLNLKNRAKAITSAAYGPENPKLPNEAFWRKKADQWDVSMDDAKQSLCGNCAAFNVSDKSKRALPKALAWKQTHGAQSSWPIWVTAKSLISSVQPAERAMHGWSVVPIRVSKKVKNLKTMKKEKRNESWTLCQH